MRKKTKDMKKYRKEWYQNNKEKHQKIVKNYCEINKSKIKAQKKKYREEHPEKHKKWVEENLNRSREINRKSAKKRYDCGIGKDYKYKYNEALITLRDKHKEEFNEIFAKLKQTASREKTNE